MPDNWPKIWKQLRANLASRPHCPEHPEFPHVRTLVRGVINDVIAIEQDGLRVRSHRSENEDFIEAERFRRWWQHLCQKGYASIKTGHPTNPDPWRSSVVGAIFVQALSGYVKQAGPSEIKKV